MYIVRDEDCPVCTKRMKHIEDDDRGEWCRSTYYCEACDQTYEKLVTFKIQSREIESEVWEDLPESDPMFEVEQYIEYTWEGKPRIGRIWKRHVSLDGKFHYHIDSPGAVDPDEVLFEDQLQLIM